MRIITFGTIRDYIQNNPDSDVALREWNIKTKQAKWKCFADVKNTFNSVDSVGNDRYVFNIKGNNYRLVALVLFKPGNVYIRFIGTHKEYDKIDCSII